MSQSANQAFESDSDTEEVMSVGFKLVPECCGIVLTCSMHKNHFSLQAKIILYYMF